VDGAVGGGNLISFGVPMRVFVFTFAHSFIAFLHCVLDLHLCACLCILEQETVRLMKEKFCYVAGDLKLEERLALETTTLTQTYTLPDGRAVKVRACLHAPFLASISVLSCAFCQRMSTQLSALLFPLGA
jgi:hypothetical protein